MVTNGNLSDVMITRVTFLNDLFKRRLDSSSVIVIRVLLSNVMIRRGNSSFVTLTKVTSARTYL